MSEPVTSPEVKPEAKPVAKPDTALPAPVTPVAKPVAKPAAKPETAAAPAKPKVKPVAKQEAKPDTVTTPVPAKPVKDSWSRLATAINGSRSVNELLKKAGLSGWNVTPQPVSALVPNGQCTDCGKPLGKKHTPDCLMEAEQPSGNGNVDEDQTSVPVKIPGLFGLIRVNPDAEFGFESIGHTTREKAPVPIEARGTILTEIVRQTKAKMGPAGPLWDNTAGFASVRLPEPVKVGKSDTVEIRAVLISSLVPGRPSQVVFSPVRVATQTVQPFTFPEFPNRVQLTADSDQDQRVSEASEALDLLTRYTEEFTQQAGKLLRKKMTVREFEDFCHTLLGGKPEDTATKPKREAYTTRMATLGVLFRGEVDLTAEIKLTRWAALQAVLTWLEHLTPPKTPGDPGITARAEDVLFGKTGTLAQDAYTLLQVV